MSYVKWLEREIEYVNELIDKSYATEHISNVELLSVLRADIRHAGFEFEDSTKLIEYANALRLEYKRVLA